MSSTSDVVAFITISKLIRMYNAGKDIKTKYQNKIETYQILISKALLWWICYC